jgi:hypothetical protein
MGIGSFVMFAAAALSESPARPFRCSKCGDTVERASFEVVMDGWPTCCDEPMEIVYGDGERVVCAEPPHVVDDGDPACRCTVEKLPGGGGVVRAVLDEHTAAICRAIDGVVLEDGRADG